MLVVRLEGERFWRDASERKCGDSMVDDGASHSYA